LRNIERQIAALSPQKKKALESFVRGLKENDDNEGLRISIDENNTVWVHEDDVPRVTRLIIAGAKTAGYNLEHDHHGSDFTSFQASHIPEGSTPSDEFSCLYDDMNLGGKFYQSLVAIDQGMADAFAISLVAHRDVYMDYEAYDEDGYALDPEGGAFYHELDEGLSNIQFLVE